MYQRLRDNNGQGVAVIFCAIIHARSFIAGKKKGKKASFFHPWPSYFFSFSSYFFKENLLRGKQILRDFARFNSSEAVSIGQEAFSLDWWRWIDTEWTGHDRLEKGFPRPLAISMRATPFPRSKTNTARLNIRSSPLLASSSPRFSPRGKNPEDFLFQFLSRI